VYDLQQLRTSEGLESLLGQVGASMAPGRQQALQVIWEHAKHPAENEGRVGAPLRVRCLLRDQDTLENVTIAMSLSL